MSEQTLDTWERIARAYPNSYIASKMLLAIEAKRG